MRLFILIFSISLVLACGQTQTKPSNIVVDRFEEFKKKEKFIADTSIFYLGVAEPSLRESLSQRINQAADDFNTVASKPSPTDYEYLEKIKTGLERFDGNSLDTEDRERICLYFEELMDSVGLASSGGLLNTFMYGFDPNDAKK
ncbi:MAG: DUF4844 domain-containing protein [Chitinophagaceae bacterium]|nr:DUF4844 domain-containing protein [Chitinophagaceae bacterium]